MIPNSSTTTSTPAPPYPNLEDATAILAWVLNANAVIFDFTTDLPSKAAAYAEIKKLGLVLGASTIPRSRNPRDMLIEVRYKHEESIDWAISEGVMYHNINYRATRAISVDSDIIKVNLRQLPFIEEHILQASIRNTVQDYGRVCQISLYGKPTTSIFKGETTPDPNYLPIFGRRTGLYKLYGTYPVASVVSRRAHRRNYKWEDIIRQYNDGELTTTTAQLAAICARMNEEHQKKLEEKVKRMNHMMEQPAPMDLDVRQQLGRAFRREIISVNHRASVAMGWNVGTLMSPQFETDWMLTTPIVSSSPRLTRKPTKKKSTVKDLMIELCNNEVDKNLTKFPWKSFKRVSNGGIIRYRNETLGCEFTGFDFGEKADTALCPSDIPYKRWSELYDALINGQISFEKL
ncbi:hypothetical protein BDB00DRAFT_943069 [Zychaea mexicana]|uniref:uncharacterized protein n=1 Tax=Zychaea mexicana TaxID=64656 RepID=UPI0022FE8992|nr:uncharacterized protein BDB00DRAFT_943069 [Zychaea mexicana]KAI9484486.1 hypothetical protein BDB00DRAFT_943069 [Zychaea mexicana]